MLGMFRFLVVACYVMHMWSTNFYAAMYDLTWKCLKMPWFELICLNVMLMFMTCFLVELTLYGFLLQDGMNMAKGDLLMK